MRTPAYLSPTSISLWERDKVEFYLKYLADHRPPPMPQTAPMAVGSAFDAYVKSYLAERLFGTAMPRELGFDVLFTAQVEAKNRDVARADGRAVFNSYITSGAAADLLAELVASAGVIKFEFRIARSVGLNDGRKVPLLGYPDLYYMTAAGLPVILDWKVNGYYSQRSPAPGYRICRDGWRGKQSRGHNMCHKDYVGAVTAGFSHSAPAPAAAGKNNHGYDHNVWSDQLTIYAWLLGVEVGGSFGMAVDQLVGPRALCRVASHRYISDTSAQLALMGRIQAMWSAIESGWIFDTMSAEDSAAQCRTLDDRHLAYGDQGDSREAWFSSATRGR